MARHTFFSFHHRNDNWRAGQVRNSWVTRDRVDAGFWDAAEWEAVKRKDRATVRKWIDEQMKGTSVTVVLIGSETSTREHVLYEIDQSHALGKGMLGIHVHGVKDKSGLTDVKGANPFANRYATRDGRQTAFATLYPTYDWVADDGRDRIGAWIEEAANKAGR